MSRSCELVLLVFLGCSSAPLEAQPAAGDRPPPIGSSRATPLDPTWPTACGSERLIRATGACIEGHELALPLRFENGRRTRSVIDGTYLLSAGDGHDYPLPGGGSKLDEQVLQLHLPTDAIEVVLPLTAEVSPTTATMTLRVTSGIGTPTLDDQGNPAGFDVQSDRWYWRSSSGSVTCRASGERILCEFHAVRFVLGEGNRPGDTPASSRPAAFPTTFDVEGWLYVVR